jgi:hypothetical protein
LENEVQVGNMYLKFFLESGDSFIKTMETSVAASLFEKLFRRVLSNATFDIDMSVLCMRCMNRLYSVLPSSVGIFDDMLVVARMIENTGDIRFQHTALALLQTLSIGQGTHLNAEQLLDRDVVSLMCHFASFAHLNPLQIGNLLTRKAEQQKLLTYGSSGQKEGFEPTKEVHESWNQGEGDTEEKKSENRGEVADVADRWGFSATEHLCPAIWYVAPPGPVPPPSARVKGPFRTSEILSYIESEDLVASSLACPSASFTSEEDEDDGTSTISKLDRGAWKPIRKWQQLVNLMLLEGTPVYSPSEVALIGLTFLQRLSTLHRAVDSRGVPYHPIPIAKRLLSAPSSLKVITQLLLANDPSVVE